MRGWLLIPVGDCFIYFHHNHLTTEDDESFLSVCAFLSDRFCWFFFFPCCVFFCFSRHLLSFCSYTMSRSRWIFADPRNQTNEIKPVLFFLFCYSSYFPLSSHLYPSLCLQSSTRWRWCVPCVTSTLTICMWAGTSPLSMAPLLVEPCLTPSSATSMPLKSLLCLFMVSSQICFHSYLWCRGTSQMVQFCIDPSRLYNGRAGCLSIRRSCGIGCGVNLMFNH